MKTSIQSEQVLLPPYTKEEIYARIGQSKRDSAAGLGQESEEMFRELETEVNSNPAATPYNG